jgi:hypothetical protein
VTPFEEFSTSGEIGPATLALLYRTVRAVGSRYSYPTPDGETVWTVDAVQQQAHDFLTGPRGLARITQLHVQATDDETFERLMHAAVRNQFRSDARRTILGKLIRRLNDVLSADPAFVHLPGNLWTLEAPIERPSTTPTPQQLLDAAWAVPNVTIRRWRAEATHQTTGADAPTLTRIAAAVLVAAGGPLPEAEVGRIIGNRLGALELPATLPIDVEEPTQLPAAADTGAAAAVAYDIWNQLSVREQLLVPVIDSSAREAAEGLKLGASQANTALQRARTTLRLALQEVDDAESVWHELVAIAISQQSGKSTPSSDFTTHRGDIRRRGELT